jgi:glycosyltransferase involved in cell wall biosynthesis
MPEEPPVSVVSFSHLGYDSDQISEVTYQTVRKLAENGLLHTLSVLDIEPTVDLDEHMVETPIPGGKTLPRMFYLFDRLSPVDLFDARQSISALFDRLVARGIGDERIVHVFPEFQHTAQRAEREQLTTVVYARGCHPEETLRLYEEEQTRFDTNIEIPHNWFNRYRRTYDHADYVFYLCDYVKETFLERGFPEERLFKVGPLTVDPDIYYPTPDDTDEFVVLAVSDMTPLKGTQYLLDAWEMLDIDNARLVLCGGMSDDVRAELGERIDRNASIDHLGHVDDIAEQYRQASVFVHPSLTEGFGKVYAEAMASELPVVATEAGPTEFIDDAGVIVPIRNAEAIAEKVRYLHDNPDEARRMGERGRAIVRANSWDGFSERVLDGHRFILNSLE